MAAFFDMSRAPRPAGDDMPDRKPAIISVAGRMHNVTCHYLQDPCSNYVQAAVEATMNVHKVCSDMLHPLWLCLEYELCMRCS